MNIKDYSLDGLNTIKIDIEDLIRLKKLSYSLKQDNERELKLKFKNVYGESIHKNSLSIQIETEDYDFGICIDKQYSDILFKTLQELIEQNIIDLKEKLEGK